MKTEKPIATRIRAARLNADFTKAEAAARAIGVAKSTYSQWESGSREPIGNNLKDIAETFNVSEDWLRYGNIAINSKDGQGLILAALAAVEYAQKRSPDFQITSEQVAACISKAVEEVEGVPTSEKMADKVFELLIVAHNAE